MKCKVCDKPILKHTKAQAIECLEDAGFSVKKTNPFDLTRQAGVSVTMNFRHGFIGFDGGKIENSKDMDTDLLRVCLVGDNIKAAKKKEEEDKGGLFNKKKSEEEEE